MAPVIVKQIYATFFTFNLLLSFNFLICEETEGVTVSNHCPDEGKAHHGEWRLDDKDGYRCILRCHHGYAPSGCNVIRKDAYGEWNYNVTCEEDTWLYNRRIACAAAVGTAILASPLLLKAFGFSVVGIAGGSLAAKYMAWSGVIPKGSLFAYLQSLGMKGIGKETVSILLSQVGNACDGLTSFFSQTACEEE